MKWLFIFLFSWIHILAYGAPSDVKTYPQKMLEFDLKLNYFQSDSNYRSSGGVYESLPNGGLFQVYDLDAGVRKTIAGRNLALFGQGRVSSSQSQVPSATRTNSGLSQVLVGADYIMYQGAFKLIPEFSFLYPLTKNDISSDSVSLGEAAMEAMARILAQVESKKLRGSLYVGFDYRDGGRSSLVPYGLTGEYKFGAFYLGGALKGFSSYGYDKDTGNEAARTSWAKIVNAGSLKYYSVNPSLLETQVWGRYKSSSDMNFLFGAGQTLNGANEAAGFNVFVGLLYRVSTAATSASEPVMAAPAAPQKIAPEEFQENTDDGVNQQLFDSQAPPPASQESSAPSAPSLQDELDKTEMQIEVKSYKKKGKKGN